jgi:tetratricopeptide (TPR) repeat protein
MRHIRTVVVIVLFALVISSSFAAKSPWVEVRSPNFLVVSNAGEKQARNTALQFELIRSVFRESVKGANTHPNPVITVLAVKDSASVRELLPEYWTNGRPHPSGAFISRFNQFFAVIDLSARGANPYRTLYHEYYHAITVPYFPNMPLWLSEGMAEFYGHTHLQQKTAVIGQTDPVLLQQLRSNALIPLDVLFKVDRTSPYYNEEVKTTLFYAESWGLVHYLMLADRTEHQSTLNAYLDALDQGKSEEEAATLFGDLKKLQSDLQAYAKGNNFVYLEEPSTARLDESALQVRPLSEAETEAYQGGFAVVRNRLPEATELLQHAVQLDPNLALAYQYLAMCQFFDGKVDDAVRSASTAISLDPKNSFTHYFRAFLDLKSSDLVPDDTQIEDDLRQAIALNPEFGPAYGLLATYLADDEDSLPECLTLAQKAVSLEPGNSLYQLDLAQVLLRMGKFDEATVAGAQASVWARNPKDKTNAESFMEELQQAREQQTAMTASEAGNSAQTDEPRADDFSSLKAAAEKPPGMTQPKPDPPLPGKSRDLQMQASLNVLNDALGYDFSAYLKNIASALRANLAANVAQGLVNRQRILSLDFVVLKNGKLAGVRVSSTSGNAALDRATRVGVASSRLPALPRGFKGQYLQLHLGLVYNPTP